MLELTDRERILTNLVRRLCDTVNSVAHYVDRSSEFPNDIYPLTDSFNREIKVGDVVVAWSSGIHPFTVAEVVSTKVNDSYGGYRAKDLVTGLECDIVNDHGIILKNFRKQMRHELLVGKERIFYKKVLKAMSEIDDWHRFADIEFQGKVCKITVREKYGGSDAEPSVPYEVSLKWNARMSVKKLIEELEKQGVGKREFEKEKQSDVSNV
jgi:hypothetical protein